MRSWTFTLHNAARSPTCLPLLQPRSTPLSRCRCRQHHTRRNSLLNYKVSFANTQHRTITRAAFPLGDKFVVGPAHVGLARLSDVPLHASTNRLARRHGSPISFSLRTHIPTVFLSIDEFSRQCFPYSPHSLLDTKTDYYL